MSHLVENPLSHAVSFLEFGFGAQHLASATGFFWRRNGASHLVTNWHNLSGRDPTTNKPLSATLGVPDRVNFSVWKRVPIPDDPLQHHLQHKVLSLMLRDDATSLAEWFEHPVHGSKIDVGVVRIEGEWPDGIEPVYANEQDFDGIVRPYVGQDVFIIGYPLGCISGVALAVWKRGTIATEPFNHYEGVPKVYVDTATRSGMSGSLVVADFLGLGDYIKLDGTKSGTLAWKGRKVFGVYSGRLSPHETQVQLGIVWKAEVIDEIIDGRKSYEY